MHSLKLSANRAATLVISGSNLHGGHEAWKFAPHTDLATQEGVTDTYVCRVLSLTCLAPDILEAILDGRQPKGLNLANLLCNIPLSWKEQRGELVRR